MPIDRAWLAELLGHLQGPYQFRGLDETCGDSSETSCFGVFQLADCRPFTLVKLLFAPGLSALRSRFLSRLAISLLHRLPRRVTLVLLLSDQTC